MEEASPTSSPSTSHHVRRRVRHQGSSDPDLDVAEEVHCHVSKRRRQLLTYSRAMIAGDSTSEEDEQHVPRWRKQLKSDMPWTRATMVVRKVTWPHDVVYTTAGKPAAYQNISIHLFIQGYMIIIEGEEWVIRERVASHLLELMSDAKLCG